MIFIPKKLKVGYNERDDTYSKKLAYVIYYDDKGKLRKETSWLGWIEEKMGTDDFENEALEGFVLNKTAGGLSYSSWDNRKTYCRVYDPRGFEIEIDISNLLYILENTNSIVGKGLEGKFIYGWDGKELVLIPTGSSDYAQIQEKTDILFNKEYLKAKDLEEGKVYENMEGKKFLFMGRRSEFKEDYSAENRLIETPKMFVFVDLVDDGDIDRKGLKDARNYSWFCGGNTYKTIPKIVQSGDDYHPSYADAVALLDQIRMFNPRPEVNTYKLRKTTVKDLENHQNLLFKIDRYSYSLTNKIGETINSDGTPGYYLIPNTYYRSYGRNHDSFTANEFISTYRLKTLIKNEK